MEKFLKLSNLFSLFILILFILLSSCTDDPTSVGNALIPDKDKLNSIVLDSQTEGFEQTFTSFQKDSLFFGSSDRILLGSYKNISSEVLISFIIIQNFSSIIYFLNKVKL
jgi:hypothetical protein